MIKIKKINSIKFIFSLVLISVLIKFKTFSLMDATTKTVKEENIDDKEEYLNISETTDHVKINKKLNWIDKANNIPKYVATPFPPLNFSQTGKRCPKKVNRQDI